MCKALNTVTFKDFELLKSLIVFTLIIKSISYHTSFPVNVNLKCKFTHFPDFFQNSPIFVYCDRTNWVSLWGIMVSPNSVFVNPKCSLILSINFVLLTDIHIQWFLHVYGNVLNYTNSILSMWCTLVCNEPCQIVHRSFFKLKTLF